MKSFPMFIRMENRRVVIVGGGEQAAQKSRLVLKTEAALDIIAEDLDDELTAIVQSGRARHLRGPITRAQFTEAALVFIGTGCPAIDASIHAIAKDAGALVNVVDQPELCDATTPSIVDRDPVVVAIGTEGTAPVLGRSIKTEVEKMLDPRLGSFAALAGRLRAAVAHRIPKEERRDFWRWAFNGPPWASFKRGAEREAIELLKSALGGSYDKETGGQIALVGAGPGARDLLTLRAVERLQEADVIFYDRLVDPMVLELARRDAERVYVGKTVGAHAFPQETISALIVAEARKGRRVVRLKSGDPSIFGRAAEEIEAARLYDIPVEIVPGITAASAAAATMSVPLTERGVTDTLVITTGMAQSGDTLPDWHRHLVAGTRLVFYMAVRTAAELAANLMIQGLGAAQRVQVAADVSTPRQKIFETRLDALAATLAEEQVSGCALIMITLPKGIGMDADLAEGIVSLREHR